MLGNGWTFEITCSEQTGFGRKVLKKFLFIQKGSLYYIKSNRS
jgi:hypothetical protein